MQYLEQNMNLISIYLILCTGNGRESSLSNIKGLIRLHSKQRELQGKRDYQQYIIL